MRGLFLFVVLLTTFIGCQKPKADLILYNGQIYTLDSSFNPTQALVIRNGRVIDTGASTITSRYTCSNCIDLKGQVVYPGFQDAHGHFTGWAMDYFKKDVSACTSFKNVIDTLRAFSQSTERVWIEGRNYDEHHWTDSHSPTKEALDEAFPERPVLLMRVDGHVALCNQKALEISGLDTVQEMEGGQIGREQGRLTGFIFDAAIARVQENIPALTDEEALMGFQQIEKKLLALGLTAVTDCWVKNAHWHQLKKAMDKKQLQLRITCMLENDANNRREFLHQKPYRDARLHLAGFKIFADGALGSRGAMLRAPYSDHSGHWGSLLISPDTLLLRLRELAASNYQCCVHAIGDSAAHLVLKTMASVLSENNSRRWRLEHAQVLSPEDTSYFKRYQIIPSVQPVHAISDHQWSLQRLGARRMQSAYFLKSLYALHGWLPLGTDFPVESPDPIQTYIAAVFRTNRQGQPQNGWHTEEQLSRKQALQGITTWAARASFDEEDRGKLLPGYFADFVILDQDLLSASLTQLMQTRVLKTYIGGREVYSYTNK